MSSWLTTLIAAAEFVETNGSGGNAPPTSGLNTSAPREERNPAAVAETASQPANGEELIHLPPSTNPLMANLVANEPKSYMQALTVEESSDVTDGKSSEEVKTFAINEEKDKKDFVMMQVPNAATNALAPAATSQASVWNTLGDGAFKVLQHPPEQVHQHPTGFDLQQQQKLQQHNVADQQGFVNHQFQHPDPNAPTNPPIYKSNTIQTMNNSRIAAGNGGGEKIQVFTCAAPIKGAFADDQNHGFAVANSAASRVPIHPASNNQLDHIHSGLRNNWGDRVVLTQFGSDSSVIQQQPGVSVVAQVPTGAKNDIHQYHPNPGTSIQRMEDHQQRPQPTQKNTSSSGKSTSLTHNQLEKNRRAHLKGCFEKLRENIPRLGTRRASNLTILKSALRHIQVVSKKLEDNQKVHHNLQSSNQLRREYHDRLYNSMVEQYGQEVIDKYLEDGLKRQKDVPALQTVASSSAVAEGGDTDTTSTATEGEEDDEAAAAAANRPAPSTNKFAFLPPGRHMSTSAQPAARYQPVQRPASGGSAPPTSPKNIPISSYRPRTPAVVLANPQMMPSTVYVHKPATMAKPSSSATTAVGSNSSNHHHALPQQQQQHPTGSGYMVTPPQQPTVTAARMVNGAGGGTGQMVHIIHPQHQQQQQQQPLAAGIAGSPVTMTATSAAAGGGSLIRPVLQGSASAVGQPQQVVYLTTMPNYQGASAIQQQHHHPLLAAPLQQQQQQQVKTPSDGTNSTPIATKPQIIQRIPPPQARVQRIVYAQASGRSATPSPPNNISSHPIQWCRGGSPMQSEFENQSSPMPASVKETVKHPAKESVAQQHKPDLLNGKLTPPMFVNQPVSIHEQQLALQVYQQHQQKSKKDAAAAAASATTPTSSEAAVKSTTSSPRLVVSLPNFSGYDVKVKYLPNACIPVQYTASVPTTSNSSQATITELPDIPAPASAATTNPTVSSTAADTSKAASSTISTTSAAPAQPSTSSPSKPRAMSRSSHQMTSLYVAASADNLGHSDPESDYESGFPIKRFSGNDVKNSDNASGTGSRPCHWRKNWIRNNVAALQPQQKADSGNKATGGGGGGATNNNSRHISALKFHNNYQAASTAPITAAVANNVTTNGNCNPVDAKHASEKNVVTSAPEAAATPSSSSSFPAPTTATSYGTGSSSNAAATAAAAVEGNNVSMTSQTPLSATKDQQEATSVTDNATTASHTSTDQSAAAKVNYALQPYSSKPTGEEAKTLQPHVPNVEVATQPKPVVQDAPKTPAAATQQQQQQQHPPMMRQTSVVTTGTTMSSMILAPIQTHRPMAPAMHHSMPAPTTLTNGPVTYQLLQTSPMPPQAMLPGGTSLFAAPSSLNYVTVANNNTNDASSSDKNSQQPQQQQQQATIVALPNNIMSFQQVVPLSVIMYPGSPAPNGSHLSPGPIMVRTSDASKMLLTRKRPSEDNCGANDEAKRVKATTQSTMPQQQQHVVLPANTQGGNVMMAMGQNGSYNIVGYHPVMQGTNGQPMHVGFPPGTSLAVAPSSFMQQQQ